MAVSSVAKENEWTDDDLLGCLTDRRSSPLRLGSTSIGVGLITVYVPVMRNKRRAGKRGDARLSGSGGRCHSLGGSTDL